MLTGIEKMIVSAVSDAKDNALPGLIEIWEKRHGGKIPKENLMRVIFPAIDLLLQWPVASKSGNIITENGRTIKYQAFDAQPKEVSSSVDRYPKAKILLQLIELLENAELSLPLSDSGNSSVYEWALENNLGDVLVNPIVQRSIIEREIQDIYISGQCEQARALADDMQDEFNINPQQFFDMLGFTVANQIHPNLAIPGPLLSLILKDLLDHHNINISMIMSSHLDTDPILNEQPAVKVYRAIVAEVMSHAPVLDQEQIDANQAIRNYLRSIEDPEHRARSANGFLGVLKVTHFTHSDANKIKKLKEIFKTLLDEGANITSMTLYNTGATQLISTVPEPFLIPISYGWDEIIVHPGYLKGFKNADPMIQYLSIHEGFFMPTVHPAKLHAHTFKLLCDQIDPNRKSIFPPPNHAAKFELNDLSRLFGPDLDPIKFNADRKADEETKSQALAIEADFNDKLAMLATLIECDLIYGLEELQSDVPTNAISTLPFQNPTNPVPYLLKDFIMDHDITRHAFEKKMGIEPVKAEAVKDKHAQDKVEDKGSIKSVPIVNLKRMKTAHSGQSASTYSVSDSKDKKKKKRH